MLAALFVLLSQTEQEPFAILGESLTSKKIEAVSISPKAEWLLAAEAGGSPRSIFVMGQKGTVAYPYPSFRLVGVLDDGSAVGVTAQEGPSGLAKLTYLMNRDGFQPIYPDKDAGSEEAWFEGWGIGPDQAVLGGVGQTMNPPRYPNHAEQIYRGGYAAIWKAGSWTRLRVEHSIDSRRSMGIFPGYAQISLADGAIGLHNVRVRESSFGAGSVIAGDPWFGVFRNGNFHPLPLPHGFGVIIPTAATLDGHTIVAEAVGVSVIWRDEVPYVKKYPGVGKVWLKGVTSDGKLAVGTWTRDHVQTAIVWDEARGARPLIDLLIERKVEVPKGWALTDAVGVSPDGRTIFGTAVSKEKTRPFRVQLPDPPSSEGGDGSRH